MSDPETTNFFRDRSVQDEPYGYFDALRARAPVWREPHYGVYMVTGYEEALAVYNDAEHFSSCNAVSGPFVPFSVPLEGDDISAIIDGHRHELPFSDQLPSFDPPRHHDHRRVCARTRSSCGARRTAAWTTSSPWAPASSCPRTPSPSPSW